MPGYGQSLLVDWSAYTRVLLAERSPGPRRLPAPAVARFFDAVEDGEIWTCPPFRLEALYSVDDPSRFVRVRAQLEGFPAADPGPDTWALAERAQAELAATAGSSHRVALPDLLIAAIAHEHGLGVLQYDRDYDVIAEHSSLEFESVWIAPRGQLD